MSASEKRWLPWFVLTLSFVLKNAVRAEILTPPYFNLAEGRKVHATATCGEDTEGPELFCKLVGATNAAEKDVNISVIQGQHCDVCDPSRPDKWHPPENAVDGLETWWQSPPLSRGMKYNEVNLTIDLGQEFHVAYVYVRMGNSPRPGLWILEKSVDYGKTFSAWQYFSDSPGDCIDYFNTKAFQPITKDDTIICSTENSQIVPLEGGEIPISLLNNRPSANHYFNSSVLQEWTRATNVRLRLLRTKNLYGHLMSVARQDPTVTRRYFYSIKDISIGGRCMCNGHADSCDNRDPNDPHILKCQCKHNTCGSKCESCCPGFEQKAWRQSKPSAPFSCEPCNCFDHSNECIYDPEVDKNSTSLDIHGRYEGGGVCLNCQHNTEGINCNKCKAKFYKPYSKRLNETDVCQACDCERIYSTGNCEEGTGRCECKPEYEKPNCDKCSFGHYGYPNCKVCDCNLNGTLNLQCEAREGKCSCKENFGGDDCRSCAEGYFNFPECEPCECNPLGSLQSACDKISGNCTCKNSYGGKHCDQCQDGYHSYPTCPYCDCDIKGTEEGICNKETGKCICKEGYAGERCDQCSAHYYDYPNCKTCSCSLVGSTGPVCDSTGKCPCLSNFAGRTCESCSPGYYKYPECLACNCDSHGANGVTCNNDGICQCHHNFDGDQCDRCKEGFYNFPACEDCNCNPAGVIAAFAGCGSVPKGELCQCKDRVKGRICDQCKPLYWNLNTYNPDGCEECKCNIPGVLGGIAVCDNDNGQCTCKPSVVARGCTECAPGTFNLEEDNLFGCTDCDCDVGGAVNPVCDKLSGQCNCQPRVTGRTCKEPLQMHYFPTLYQHQYEVEDGRTQDSIVRYSYNETDFPGYSYKGYAVFNTLQREVLKDVYIYKPSLYRLIFRYINKNPDTVMGTIKIVPDNPNDIEQKYHMQFINSTKPVFTTLMSGNAPVALVMNPGSWTVSILVEKNLLLDYFVLLPEEFYLASILNQKVEAPCTINNTDSGLCREFRYPNISNYDISLGAGGYVDLGSGDIATPTEYYDDSKHLNELNVRNNVPLINEHQKEIDYNITLSRPGHYMILVNYITPLTDQRTHTVEVGVINNNDIGFYKFDKIELYNCPYNFVCRQVVTDRDGIVAVYNADENLIHIKLKGEDSNVGIQSIVAIPDEEWSLDFIHPRPICIRKDGACVRASFPNPPESKKIQFEKEAITNEGHNKTIVKASNMTTYIRLNQTDNMVDVRSKVPIPGFYTFIVHFYQPEFPKYDIDILIQNGLFYEAKLPVSHCPSESGCRGIVVQKDGNTKFSLTENFMITLKLPQNKNVFLDYLLVVPHDLYQQRMLEEEDLDRTGEFINSCGNNNFYVDPKAQDGFCKDSVFSITSGYNNGALPCQCDYDGSLSFQCEKFGGQCQCKPNVIGRQCTVCKTGYYGFPECKPCNCPSSSTCEPSTGQCICPRNVVGELCDQCDKYTYGFDPFSGCEECKCDSLGSTSYECDLYNGTCSCKPNIVNRKCDTCLAGHFAFPYCSPCECELRGTIDEICDQQTAECFCKKSVTGPACDICKDGTYDLQDSNEVGCTECFCFGKTSRCYSSSLYKAYIEFMDDWEVVTINETDGFEVNPLSLLLNKDVDNSVGFDLEENIQNLTLYYAAPPPLLGKKLVSYGGLLNYSLSYTIGESGEGTMKPDIILEGVNTYLIYNSLEQPAAIQDNKFSLEMVEYNFNLPNKMPAKREHLMNVLKDLQGIYIRATYWNVTESSKLIKVTLDGAVNYVNSTNYVLASSVEHCECPPNYQGLSCEECSPGYYRISSGPHGGYCVPCQCNGHAEECDVNTGVCLACQHNTVGDHCEMCAVGYHGTIQGTPQDCLICACPLPVTSNNFASTCEVTADGEKISCECNDGYIGARCQSCGPGFYGQPEVIGDICKPCNCSGNINPNEHGSCDTVTGQCLKCLNNTFGEACALCAPGYFGDAIVLKDCQTCVCDEVGTEKCNSYTGECMCKQNVVGDKCDRCEVDHYGFQSGYGCKPCDCGEASNSLQCDDTTGQCRCKPGVTGRTCDKCAAGYWNYTEEGCVSCGCKSEYSLGFGCNTLTGQCECLQGVTGEKCDHCPYRWAFVAEYGCFACDSCTHDLLDHTDELAALIDPVIKEFDSRESGYFTTRRLAHINDTIKQLKPKVLLLSPDQVNLAPITQELESVEQESSNMLRKANYSLDNSKTLVNLASELREKSMNALDEARDASDDAADTIDNIEQLAIKFTEGEGPRIDTARQEAESVLKQMKGLNLDERDNSTNDKLDEVLTLFAELKTYKEPIHLFSKNIQDLKGELRDFNDKLDDLSNQTQYSLSKSAEAKELYDKNGKERVENKLDNIKAQTEDTEKALKDSNILLKNATQYLADAKDKFRSANDILDNLEQENNNFNSSIEPNYNKLQEIYKLLPKVQEHAGNLSKQAMQLDNLLTETRNSSENAVKAATAYNNIIKAIEDAEAAAEKSKEVVDETAATITRNVADSLESDDISGDLLDDAHEAETNISELDPQMKEAKQTFAPVSLKHMENEEQMKGIEQFVENYQTNSLDETLKGAVKNADKAEKNAKKTMNELKKGFKEIENRTERAKQLPNNIYDANKDIEQVKQHINKVNEKLPELVDALSNMPTQYNNRLVPSDIEEKIKKLNQQIAIARDLANRIEVGVKFSPSTILELKNPENLAELSTSTQISGYFKTDNPNGLLLYLGNGEGTNLRKTDSDDFMALEIENGYPVLTLDMGNGQERIINNKYVSDDNWYKFIIDRTGLNAKLSIVEQLDDGTSKESMKEHQLEGPYSIFNLDKNQSKLFVGSYPMDFKMQEAVRQSSFDGSIEGLVIGETPVSLWNFNSGYENNQGAQQRDKLRNIQSTGYRFNGNGYAIMNSRSYPFRARSDIKLSFKTFAPEGLLFLYGKGKTFIALELRNGKVLYKYNLGSGTKVWQTTRSYNDGNWHVVEAVRDGAKGRFVVDQENISDRSKQISGSLIEPDDTAFFGGYPQMHDIADVTNVDFDGCIDNVIIMSNPVDLSGNVKAYGVTPGCPVKFSRLVSFSQEKPGYIKKDNVSSPNDLKVNLKFKTKAKDGLIFYVADRNDQGEMSLSLEDGHLKLVSQKIVIVSKDNTFNDNEWHVVSVRHNKDALRLDFDDYGYKVTDDAPPPLYIIYGDIYIGGKPVSGSDYVPFSGCIGDATVNGNIINFANSTDKYGEIVGRCILDKEIGSDSDIHTVPVLPPIVDIEHYTTQEPEEQTQNGYESNIPKRGDGGKDTGGDDTEDHETEDDHEDGDGLEGDLIPDLETTTWPTPRPHPTVTTSEPPKCALPIDPIIDDTQNSYRYGVEKDSRLQYPSARGKYKKAFDFSLSFRTSEKNGILLYVADSAEHDHFVALFLRDGFVSFLFDGGAGMANITSYITCDDSIWHKVEISRDGSKGKLVIDEIEVTEGRTPGNTPKIELYPPYYLGGIEPQLYNHVFGKINTTAPFKGCIRDFKMNNKEMEHPEKFGVLPCSDNVEAGVFFSSKGGFVKLEERFSVGLELDVKMDIKPRNLSGLIMSVHGKKDYFVLELDNGSLKFTVDNGRGMIMTSYNNSNPHFFCDGHWHSIQAIKSKSVVTLAVDGVHSQPGLGDHRFPRTDTRGFLFLGGHRMINRAKGITVRVPYTGCIKNVQIKNQVIPITQNMAEGGVMVGSCPTN